MIHIVFFQHCEQQTLHHAFTEVAIYNFTSPPNWLGENNSIWAILWDEDLYLPTNISELQWQEWNTKLQRKTTSKPEDVLIHAQIRTKSRVIRSILLFYPIKFWESCVSERLNNQMDQLQPIETGRMPRPRRNRSPTLSTGTSSLMLQLPQARA